MPSPETNYYITQKDYGHNRVCFWKFKFGYGPTFNIWVIYTFIMSEIEVWFVFLISSRHKNIHSGEKYNSLNLGQV